jgi:geranylgeranyl diphosphate synthase type II
MGGRTYRQQLDAYRDLAIGALLDGIPKNGPRYLYDLARAYPARAGKGLRAALCLATCRAFGGSERQALNSAVALELFHNAFLVFDDIQDGSRFRRGEATLHTSHGTAIAINVGNATGLLAQRRLMDNNEILGRQTNWLLMQEADRMLGHSLEGQAMELAWIHDNESELAESDYLSMCLKKTCWYSFIYPMRVGAIVATGGGLDFDQFCQFGWYLGAAFQIQDDLLNLEGEFETYGKEIDGDLVEGKRTLILIHLLRHCSGRERAELQRTFQLPAAARSAAAVGRIRALMKRYGSLNYARVSANQLAGAALLEGLSALRDLPDSEAKTFILETALFVATRDR